jgi:transcriptional regulator with XRE-family HTH domain
MIRGSTDVTTLIGAIKSRWGNDLQNFGESLQLRRESLHLTQPQMSAQIGVRQSTISRIETGDLVPEHPTAKAVAREYRLDETETNLWYQLLYGVSTYGVENLEYGQVLRAANVLIGKVEKAFEAKTEISEYLGKIRYPQVYIEIANTYWDEIQPIIWWLISRPRGVFEDMLLVKFSDLLMHYFNMQGFYQERLSFATAAAQVARRLEQKTIEGWLRCDGISWILIEQYEDPVQAQTHLGRAMELAHETRNRDMLALATTFLARTHVLQDDIKTAQRLVNEVLAGECSGVVQSRAYQTAGNIAFLQRKFEKAITCFDNANKANLSFWARLRAGDSYLAIGEAALAKEQFAALLPEIPFMWLTPHKHALATWGLAQTAKIEGDLSTAEDLAREAEALLQPILMRPSSERVEAPPYLQRKKKEVQRFLTDLYS